MLCSCQLDASVVTGAKSAPSVVLARDTSERVSALNELKKTKGALGAEVTLEGGPGGPAGPPAFLYVVPCTTCNESISMEFAAACLTPMSTLLHLGYASSPVGPPPCPGHVPGSSVMDSAQHGVRPLEAKLEMLLLASSGVHATEQKKLPR